MKWYVENKYHDGGRVEISVLSEKEAPEIYALAKPEKPFYKSYAHCDVYADVFDTHAAALAFKQKLEEEQDDE